MPISLILFLLIIAAPASAHVTHPAWSRDATIYEVNVRQYTPSGTFQEFETHLPRLKEMGIDILWLMPIHPIGEENRKGSLGSYYSVKDYLAVNPEFGTMEDFKGLVKEIHDQGMYVILDWVANHCAWDNSLVSAYPEWFTLDSTGSMISPVPDWHDVVDFNYDNADLRAWMIDALKFWVRETDIDGYRCDVAGMVPQEFWMEARTELDELKPVFMLAEDEDPVHHEQAFDMTYSWELHHLMVKIADGKETARELAKYFRRDASRYSDDAYRMLFTDNHDENTWNGTVFERFGEGAEAFAVLALTAPGMPLVYSGQETGLDKRLRFFDKDTIEWREHPFAEVYTALLNLKHTHRALWNGDEGGRLTPVPTSKDDAIFAFTREKRRDRILVILNLSSASQTFSLRGRTAPGSYRDAFSNHAMTVSVKDKITLGPWEYRVLIR